MHTELPGDFKITNAEPTDHPRIVSVMKEWWRGRDLTHTPGRPRLPAKAGDFLPFPEGGQ